MSRFTALVMAPTSATTDATQEEDFRRAFIRAPSPQDAAVTSTPLVTWLVTAFDRAPPSRPRPGAEAIWCAAVISGRAALPDQAPGADVAGASTIGQDVVPASPIGEHPIVAVAGTMRPLSQVGSWWCFELPKARVGRVPMRGTRSRGSNPERGRADSVPALSSGARSRSDTRNRTPCRSPRAWCVRHRGAMAARTGSRR